MFFFILYYVLIISTDPGSQRFEIPKLIFFHTLSKGELQELNFWV